MKNNYINIYYETELTDNGIKNYKLSLIKEKNIIIGHRINLKNNKENILIGKLLEPNLVEIIELDSKIRKVLYGHITKDGSVYGNWKECNKIDLHNLISKDNYEIPKSVIKEKLSITNSKISLGNYLEDKNSFYLKHQKLLDSLSYTDEESYQYIKKLNN